MGCTDPSDRAKRRTKVKVVTCRENASAALTKLRDARAVGLGETIACVDCEKPKLVELRPLKR